MIHGEVDAAGENETKEADGWSPTNSIDDPQNN